jgi:nitrogen fixation/metabolism regulation signal transduction histidine kinase
MRTRREPGASLTGLVSLIILYVVLSVLVVVFAGQVLTDLSFSQSTASTVALVIAVLFPALLVALIVFNVVRLLGDRAARRPGAFLKSRLLLFFVVVVLLASVPQGVLSISFLRTATEAWFSEETGDAIRGGQEMALSFFGELERDLVAFAESAYTPGLLTDVDSRPDRVWDRVHGVNPMIDSFQVFDSQFTQTYAGGDESLHLQSLEAAAAREGQAARESRGDASFIRMRLGYDAPDGEPYTVIVAARLPEGFDASASRLTQSLAFFTQLEQFQDRFLLAVALFYAAFSFPLLLLSFLVSFLLSDEIMRPIVSLEEATRRVADGDFSTRILTRRGDELATLVNSFNRMVGELERARETIIQTEKIAAWQEIAQRLAHEVKNPLTPIRLAAERTLRKYRNESPDFASVLESSVRSIVGEVDNLSSLLSEFREFSRLPEPQITSVDVSEIATEVTTTYSLETKAEVRLSGEARPVRAMADPGQLRQVLGNLVKNAVDAVGDDGWVVVSADLITKEGERYVRVRVEDNGKGIDPERAAKVFDPYVTSKPNGTGLGLAIVQRIVFDHHGHIWFESEPGVGTTFYVDLPAAPSGKA